MAFARAADLQSPPSAFPTVRMRPPDPRRRAARSRAHTREGSPTMPSFLPSVTHTWGVDFASWPGLAAALPGGRVSPSHEGATGRPSSSLTVGHLGHQGATAWGHLSASSVQGTEKGGKKRIPKQTGRTRGEEAEAEAKGRTLMVAALVGPCRTARPDLGVSVRLPAPQPHCVSSSSSVS